MTTLPSSADRTLRLRPMKLDDFDAVVALQLRCFPGMGPWRREQIESQLQQRNYEGFLR